MRARACGMSELRDGEAHQVIVEGNPIALVRCGDDLYAVGDVCSHQRISLSEGEVMCDTLQIECWKHGSAFSLITGEPHALPATKPVPVFPVSIEGDDVMVEVP